MESKQIATTILAQLGGGRFKMITGAKNCMAVGPLKVSFATYLGGLTFQLPRMSGVKARIVNINLTASDLYDMIVMDAKTNVIASAKGLYAEDLIDAFECKTGVLAKFSGALPQKG